MGSSGWFALTVSKDADRQFSVWSPTGAYDLVVSPSWGGTSSATLATVSGQVIRTYESADYAVWLDDQRFMIISETSDYTNVARIGSVATEGLTKVDVPDGSALGNGHGAVAFRGLGSYDTTDCGGFCANTYEFSIWQDGSVSKSRDGDPVAWSPDGTQLYVLNDVRKIDPDTGAPAADDFVGWLEVLSLPNLDSVRKYPTTKITDRSIALDPSGKYLLYETIGDHNDDDYVHVLNLASGGESKFNMSGSWFTWDAAQEIVVAPAQAGSEVVYGSDGEPSSVAQSHGRATVRDVHGDVVDTWNDIGRVVVSAADGQLVASYDQQFMNTYAFVTVIGDGKPTVLPALPIDGWLADECWLSVAPDAAAVSADCSLIPPAGGIRYGLSAIYPLR
jgi:hypothetical protein